MGLSHSLIDAIFWRLIQTPSLPIIYLKKLIFSWWKRYFSGLSFKFFLLKYLSTLQTFLIWSFRALPEYTKILFKQVIIYSSRIFLNILFISSCFDAGVLVNLKGIIKYSKNLYLIRNTVFYSSPFFMRIRLYAFY